MAKEYDALKCVFLRKSGKDYIERVNTFIDEMVLTISNQDVSYQVSEDAMQQAVCFFNQPMPAISEDVNPTDLTTLAAVKKEVAELKQQVSSLKMVQKEMLEKNQSLEDNLRRLVADVKRLESTAHGTRPQASVAQPSGDGRPTQPPRLSLATQITSSSKQSCTSTAQLSLEKELSLSLAAMATSSSTQPRTSTALLSLENESDLSLAAMATSSSAQPCASTAQFSRSSQPTPQQDLSTGSTAGRSSLQPISNSGAEDFTAVNPFNKSEIPAAQVSPTSPSGADSSSPPPSQPFEVDLKLLSVVNPPGDETFITDIDWFSETTVIVAIDHRWSSPCINLLDTEGQRLTTLWTRKLNASLRVAVIERTKSFVVSYGHHIIFCSGAWDPETNSFKRSSEKQIYHHPRFDIDAMIALGPSTVAALMRGYVVIMDTEGRVHAELGNQSYLTSKDICATKDEYLMTCEAYGLYKIDIGTGNKDKLVRFSPFSSYLPRKDADMEPLCTLAGYTRDHFFACGSKEKVLYLLESEEGKVKQSWPLTNRLEEEDQVRHVSVCREETDKCVLVTRHGAMLFFSISQKT